MDISKFAASSPFGPQTFLHRVHTSGAKTRPVLRNIANIIIICKNDYSDSLFLQDAPSQMSDRVLNMSFVPNMSLF